MKDMVKSYPIPALFTAMTFLLIGAEAYVGYQNSDYLYKELELQDTQRFWSVLLTSYGLITLTILAVLVAFKLVDCIGYKRVSPPNLLKASWWWVVVILPSPLYVLAMLSFEEVWSVTVNRLFIASAVMFFVSCVYTVRKDLKRAIIGEKGKK